MRYPKLSIVVLVAAVLAGCSSFWNLGTQTRSGVSSSLVDYLYPNGEVPPDIQDTIPYLELPLRAGIAFVPAQTGRSVISEATKVELLEKVRAEFADREFIELIEVIPDNYLRTSKGVTGMQQVARLYGVDVMALVSYDQVAVSEDNPESFLYWTIVGSYFIKGTSNEVQTFVGLDRTSDRSTLVEAGEVVRKSREASFGTAMELMTQNLAVELDGFRERIREDPQVAQVEWKPGYGGGATGPWFLLGLLAVAVRRRVR